MVENNKIYLILLTIGKPRTEAPKIKQQLVLSVGKIQVKGLWSCG